MIADGSLAGRLQALFRNSEIDRQRRINSEFGMGWIAPLRSTVIMPGARGSELTEELSDFYTGSTEIHGGRL